MVIFTLFYASFLISSWFSGIPAKTFTLLPVAFTKSIHNFAKIQNNRGISQKQDLNSPDLLKTLAPQQVRSRPFSAPSFFVNPDSKIVKPIATAFSLDTEKAPLRSVLQFIADFAHLNIILSDSIKGNLSLHLKNVSWQEAFNSILQMHGLTKKHRGNILLIAPLEEISTLDNQFIKNNIQNDLLLPLYTTLISLHYTKATDMVGLIKDKDQSLLSKRGTIRADPRTNTIWLEESQENIKKISHVIANFDQAIPQILIEARIVTLNKAFENSLGIEFINSPNPSSAATFKLASPFNFALGILKKANTLDLELAALESEGRGQVIAAPHLLTLNQQTAVIEAGDEIPYEQAMVSGATSIAFKKAVLSLQVTPQLLASRQLLLNLKLTQDTPSLDLVKGVPAIHTKALQTRVLVENGETIVLGGIFSQNTNHLIHRIPLLGTIPKVGRLFQYKTASDKREELLIFITPKVVSA